MNHNPSIENAVREAVGKDPANRQLLIDLVVAWQVVSWSQDCTDVAVLQVTDDLLERVERIIGQEHVHPYEGQFMALVKTSAKSVLL